MRFGPEDMTPPDEHSIETCEADALPWTPASASPPTPAGAGPSSHLQDPLDTPLPCDITAGHVTFQKGVRFRSVALRMQALYDLAVDNIGTKEEVDQILGITEIPAKKAVLHLINRMQADPRIAYLIGPGSESFELLVTAAALADGIETDVLRERVLGWISPQPVPGIGQAAGVLDQDVWDEMLEVNNCALDVDKQSSVDFLVNHFVRLGLAAYKAERDAQTEELF